MAHTNARAKAIVVLGAGIMQIPLMLAIKKRGYRVIACDINARAVGKKYCDMFWNLDLSDTEHIVEKIAHSIYLVQAVLTAATDFSYAVATIAQKSKLAGLIPEQAKNFVFKDRMRTLLQNAGVSVPKFSILDEQSITKKSYRDIASSLGFPLVVKPLHNMGSRGVQKAHAIKQLDEAVEHALLFSKKHLLILEQMLEGPELSIDAVLYNNTLYVMGIADRHIYFSPHCIELGHSIPSQLSKEMIESACNETKKAAIALGMRTGICKADIIFHDGLAYIGELAARLSGGYMSGWTAPVYLRENINSIAIDLAIAKTIPLRKIHTIHTRSISHLERSFDISTLNNRAWRLCTAERTLVSLPGTIVAIRSSSTIHECIAQSQRVSRYSFECMHQKISSKSKRSSSQTSDEVFAIYFHKKIGDHSCLPKNNTQKTASLLIKAEHVSKANEIAARTIADIFVDVTINRKASAFLFSLQQIYQNSPWRCFALNDTLKKLEQGTKEDNVIEIEQRKSLLSLLKEHDVDTLFQLSIENKNAFIAEAKNQQGAWTFCTLYDTLQIASDKKILELNYAAVSTEETLLQQCIWRAMLRAGWQGLYYTRKLIRECPQEITSYL